MDFVIRWRGTEERRKIVEIPFPAVTTEREDKVWEIFFDENTILRMHAMIPLQERPELPVSNHSTAYEAIVSRFFRHVAPLSGYDLMYVTAIREPEPIHLCKHS